MWPIELVATDATGASIPFVERELDGTARDRVELFDFVDNEIGGENDVLYSNYRAHTHLLFT